MGGIMTKLSSLDADQVFGYNTIKMVRVQDRRLGLMHIFFTLAILTYVVLYEVVLQQGYLRREKPTAGAVRISAQTPLAGFKNVDELAYCAAAETGPVDPSSSEAAVLPCIYGSEYQVVYPPDARGDMMLTTRISDTVFPLEVYENTTRVCEDINLSASNNAECFRRATDRSHPDYYDFQPQEFTPQKTFMAQVEDFSLLVVHSVSSDLLDIQRSSTQMKAKLLDQDGNEVWEVKPEERAFQDSDAWLYGDLFTLDDLLRAGGMSGDSPLDELSDGVKDETFRYDGITITLRIYYENRRSDSSTFKYSYSVSRAPGGFKSEEVMDGITYTDQWGNSVKSVKLRNRHGVLIHVVQEGVLGKFYFTQLLITLVTGLALSKLAITIVDMIMLYFMSHRTLYQGLKYTKSEDFSDVRKQIAEENDLEMEEKNAKKVKQRAKAGANSSITREHSMDVDI